MDLRVEAASLLGGLGVVDEDVLDLALRQHQGEHLARVAPHHDKVVEILQHRPREGLRSRLFVSESFRLCSRAFASCMPKTLTP